LVVHFHLLLLAEFNDDANEELYHVDKYEDHLEADGNPAIRDPLPCTLVIGLQLLQVIEVMELEPQHYYKSNIAYACNDTLNKVSVGNTGQLKKCCK
jgi:hypothetical protein